MALAASPASGTIEQKIRMSVPPAMRREVIRRAGNRCEYCGLAQAGQEAVFHIDHVVPQAEKGPTSLDNLALACVSCSLRKSARRTATDPQSGDSVPLFNPRRDRWADHFLCKSVRIAGRTATGRATVDFLKMNRLLIQAIREEEKLRGRHPPPRKR
jgi:hypothetical protein